MRGTRKEKKNALVHMHSVWLDVCSTDIHLFFFFLVPRTCAVYHYFIVYSLLPPAELSWSEVFKQLCNLDGSCPVIEINSF
jgi:hypothetical protein